MIIHTKGQMKKIPITPKFCIPFSGPKKASRISKTENSSRKINTILIPTRNWKVPGIGRCN